MISLFIYEILAIIALNVILPIFEEGKLDFNSISKASEIILQKLGLKWLFFIIISQHLSVGFFCLTTFSDMFHEIKNIKKFYIINCLEVIVFYFISLFFLKLIRDSLGGFFRDKINGVQKAAEEREIKRKYERTYEIFEMIIDYLFNITADFLSTYNIYLETTVLGTLYLFLFYEPKALQGKKMLYFRLLSAIPISFIIISILLRALHNTEIIKLNEYVLPLLLGSKITVYGFFISTLLTIKYKSLTYNVFDEENYINPRVFSKIGSKNFGIFGILELLIGLFFPDWSVVGIGGNYLLVLCAPIMTLYDYKKKYKVSFPFCKKGDMSRCLKIVFNIFGYSIICILGLIIIIKALQVIRDYIKPILDFLIDNFNLVVNAIELLF